MDFVLCECAPLISGWLDAVSLNKLLRTSKETKKSFSAHEEEILSRLQTVQRFREGTSTNPQPFKRLLLTRRNDYKYMLVSSPRSARQIMEKLWNLKRKLEPDTWTVFIDTPLFVSNSFTVQVYTYLFTTERRNSPWLLYYEVADDLSWPLY